MPEPEIYISDVCGSSWWGALHGVVGAINCSSCREHGAQLLSGMHDLINFALGKPIYDPKNFNDVANYYHTTLQELIAKQEQHAALGQGEHHTEFGFYNVAIQARLKGIPVAVDDAVLDAIFGSSMLQLSRFRCMSCQDPPEIEVLWAEGRARAWFCNDCFDVWELENGDDIVSRTKIDGEARSTNRSRRAGMGLTTLTERGIASGRQFAKGNLTADQARGIAELMKRSSPFQQGFLEGIFQIVGDNQGPVESKPESEKLTNRGIASGRQFAKGNLTPVQAKGVADLMNRSGAMTTGFFEGVGQIVGTFNQDSERQDFAQELEDAAELELSALADFALPAFDEVTKKICEAMERGVVPWRRPWSKIASARNAVTNRSYSGINPFLLALSGFTDPRWMTFKQAKRLGGNVLKGSKGTTIIFWKLLRKNVGVSPGTTTDDDDDETTISRVVPLLRHYTVFNIEQTEGTKLPAFEPEVVDKVEAIDEAEAVIQGYPNPPTINDKGGDRAFYRPSTDTVSLPARSSFNDSAAFYETAFHELGHSTGHETRLNRRDEEPAPFGSPVYAREELVAEFCAAFLMQDVGLDSVIENAASYINGWTKAIQNDPKMIVVAATRGEKAALHILGPQAREGSGDDDDGELENRFGASVPVLELADLADPPGLAMVKKFGRTYTFTRTFRDGETAPEVTTGLTKAEALKMFDDTVRDDQGFEQSQPTAAQIERAGVLGKEWFEGGGFATPMADPRFREFFTEEPDAPIGWIIPLFEAWEKAWHKANAAAPIEDQFGTPRGMLAELLDRDPFTDQLKEMYLEEDDQLADELDQALAGLGLCEGAHA